MILKSFDDEQIESNGNEDSMKSYGICTTENVVADGTVEGEIRMSVIYERILTEPPGLR